MSAPPLFRLVDERRVSVVRDAAAVRRVLDDDPVGSCMVASRVAEHGIEPDRDRRRAVDAARRRPSRCATPGANLIPLRGELDRSERVRRQGDEHRAALLVAGRAAPSW